MKTSITGGRDFVDYELFCSVLDNLIPYPTMIIAGGATGADHFAYLWAKDRGVTFVCHPPLKEELEEMGFARAAKRRNMRIVADTDRLIAFPTSGSKGTWHTVGLANKLGVPVTIIKGE